MGLPLTQEVGLDNRGLGSGCPEHGHDAVATRMESPRGLRPDLERAGKGNGDFWPVHSRELTPHPRAPIRHQRPSRREERRAEREF